MDRFYNGADIGDIAHNLVVLSLDAIRPALGLLHAPALTDADYHAVRAWTGLWSSFEFFPYTDDMAFADSLASLAKSLPKGRAAALVAWAMSSTPLTDPTKDDGSDHPANAAYEWRSALVSARDLGRLAVLELSDAGRGNLLSILKEFDDRMAPVEAFAQTLAKEWEPYPDDPGQWAYNLKVKSEWDRHVYQTFCQFKSFSLHFDVEFTVRDQQTHRFVRDYAARIPPSDHATIHRDLAMVLQGQGHFALHPWMIERLRDCDDAPIEKLLPFTRDPL